MLVTCLLQTLRIPSTHKKPSGSLSLSPQLWVSRCSGWLLYRTGLWAKLPPSHKFGQAELKEGAETVTGPSPEYPAPNPTNYMQFSPNFSWSWGLWKVLEDLGREKEEASPRCTGQWGVIVPGAYRQTFQCGHSVVALVPLYNLSPPPPPAPPL